MRISKVWNLGERMFICNRLDFCTLNIHGIVRDDQHVEIFLAFWHFLSYNKMKIFSFSHSFTFSMPRRSIVVINYAILLQVLTLATCCIQLGMVNTYPELAVATQCSLIKFSVTIFHIFHSVIQYNLRSCKLFHVHTDSYLKQSFPVKWYNLRNWIKAQKLFSHDAYIRDSYLEYFNACWLTGIYSYN